ncbi:hypothetical protein KC19_5G089700 [Ceratodon purpureus]|uniref:Uncharacterized protein n=1 Tax=Ceratodon purpureus TaxID=3225 RepID=A0A8T0HZE5_CERPU|nr:hypothetical protein KC19_5G089700 [Ceratodon purpureus]
MEISSRDGSRDVDKSQTEPVGTEDEPPASVTELGASSTSKEERPTQQVAIAQSSIKRLQMVVKEKEDIIVTLQNAVSEAYEAALQEQAQNQAQLEALHEVFLANAGGQNRSTSAAKLHKALQALARKGPDPKSSISGTSTVIKAVARLMDDHLEQLASSHENEMQELNKSLESYKNRNQLLETQLADVRTQHQIHINNIVEEVRKQIPDDEHQRRSEIEKYQNQLSRLSFASA